VTVLLTVVQIQEDRKPAAMIWCPSALPSQQSVPVTVCFCGN